jgi:hypothetical protein
LNTYRLGKKKPVTEFLFGKEERNEQLQEQNTPVFLETLKSVWELNDIPVLMTFN